MMKRLVMNLSLRAAVGCGACTLLIAPPAQAAKPAPADDAAVIAKLAKQRFKEGQFEVAARLFVRAYEISRRPALLYNAGRAREMEGNTESALRLYRTYIDIEKDIAGREEARVRISVLEEGGARDTARPTAPAEAAHKDSDGGAKAATPGGQVDKIVAFQPGGQHKLGIKVGRLSFDEIVLHNMPKPADIEEAKKDPGDSSRPKIAVVLSNPGGPDVDVKMKVSLETASGEVLMSCEGGDSVGTDARADRSNLCWIASMKTLDWPKLARVHLVATVTAKKP